MDKPSLEQLNNFRKEGFRPGVVGCLVFNKTILMLYKKDYKLWQLPQGRIRNKEEPKDALRTMVEEELGKDFAKNVSYEDIQFVMDDKIEFKPGRHEMEKMEDDDGNEVTMLGKVYFFAILNCSTNNLDITKTQFDENFWMSYREALFLAEKIYQKGKKRVTIKVLAELFKLGAIE